MTNYRVVKSIEEAQATFNAEANWSDPWQQVTCRSLRVAMEAARGTRKRPSSKELDKLNEAFETAARLTKKGLTT